MKKKTLFLTILLTFLLVPTFVIGAYSYNYDFFKNPIYSSEGLTFKDAIGFSEIFQNVNYEDNKNFIGDSQKFIDLSDLAVYGHELYVLDGASTASSQDAVKFKVYATGENKTTPDVQEVTISKNSGIYILNQDYTIKERVNIFEITEEAATALAESYYYQNTDEGRKYLFDAKNPGAISVKEIQAATNMIDKNNKTIRAPFFAYDIP